MKTNELIEGEKYILFDPTCWSHPSIFIYDGVWEGFNCDKCGKVRKKIYTFVQGNRKTGNLTQVAKYGSECLKRIKIEKIW